MSDPSVIGITCSARSGGYWDTKCWMPAAVQRDGHPLCIGHARQFDRWANNGMAKTNAHFYWRWAA